MDDVKIAVDPAVSLAPKRFGLPQHTVEEEAGVSVGVAAEFLDIEPSLLEARRKELFGKAEI
jgi:predicted metallo-beta-lactamase superfamily hydrolase